MKKMTGKEFKEIINEIGLVSDDTYERVLNMLSILYRDKAGITTNECLKKVYYDRSNKLFEELDKRGYYDNL